MRAFRSPPAKLRRAAEGTITTWEVSDAFGWAALHDTVEPPLRFGYSNLVRVYLNGRVLYASDNR